MPTLEEYIKPSYKFVEINEMMKLPLETKIEISVAVIKQALRLCKHKAAIAFSGGKDSEVVADLIERFCPSEFEKPNTLP